MKSRTCIIDTEANGLEPTKVHCMVLKDIQTGEVFKFVKDEVYENGRSFLTSEVKYLIGHNIIEYDIPKVLNKLLGIPWDAGDCSDTYVMSRLAYSDRYKKDVEQGRDNLPKHLVRILRDKSHSLEAWGIRVKRYKPDITDWSEYTPEMLNRCVEDVEINHKVFNILTEELKNFSKYSVRLEHRVAEIIAEQCRNGVTIDVKECESLYFECKAKSDVIREELVREVNPLIKRLTEGYIEPKITEVKVWNGEYTINPKTGRKVKEYLVQKTISTQTKYYKYVNIEGGFPIRGPFSSIVIEPFNPDSPQQRLQVLEDAGWKPVNFNLPTEKMKKEGRKKGNPKTTDEDNLATLPKTAPKAIFKLADYIMLTNRYKLAEQWLGLIDPKTNKIHGYVNSIGTPTARMRHDSPNLGNIVRIVKDSEGNALKGFEGRYGWECRNCFTVSDTSKYVMVGADASGLELRMLAHFMNDYAYTKELLEGDIHTVNQAAAGLDSRDDAKTLIYAIVYGAGDTKVGTIVNGSRLAGQRLKDKFLGATPSLEKLITKTRDDAKKGWITGLDGRRLWVRKPHAALNTLLQSAGAIIMKQALVMAYKEIKKRKLDAWFILNVHDEVQLECRIGSEEEVGAILVDSIRKSGEFFGMNVPLDGEWKKGRSWAFTH